LPVEDALFPPPTHLLVQSYYGQQWIDFMPFLVIYISTRRCKGLIWPQYGFVRWWAHQQHSVSIL
jgi:hypothetical protein